MQSGLVLLVALVPLWIQATFASAQIQFTTDWTHGKRSAGRPRPLPDLRSAGGAAEMCPLHETAVQLIYQVVMREVERVMECRIRSGQYDTPWET